MVRTAVRLLAISASTLALAACGVPGRRDTDPSLVRIDAGTLRGLVAGDSVEFRGIPYAAPPVGGRRFAPPVAPASWSGLRDATRFAAACPQGEAIDEDCLYLNLVAPRAASAKRLPVMVWLHGGGFSSGTANSYGAHELAAQGGVIVVGVEFRLNVFGLLALPGMPGAGSLILQDQQAALRWVRRNIAAFGGDPTNVTLFGESGGAIGTCAQLVSPGARGLFHKAILQSGSCSTSFAADFVARGVPAGSYFAPLADMEAQGLSVAKAVGCPAPAGPALLACLRRVPAGSIAKAGAALFSASFGTPTLPIDPSRAMAGGDAAPVPILTGFNREEGLAMVAGMQLVGAPVTASDYPTLVRGAFGARASGVLAQYPLSRFDGRGDLAWARIVTDRMFACPQLRDAARLARAAPVFAYEFADPDGAGLIPMPPGLPRGPSHTSELPLLFRLADGPIDIATGKRIARSAGQQRLSTRMIAAWTRFARTGSPGDAGDWRRFDPERRAVTWLTTPGAPGSPGNAAVVHRCAFWDGV